MKRYIQLAFTAILLIRQWCLVAGRNTSEDNRRVLKTLDGQAGVTASSLCYLPSGVVLSGPSDCPGGEVHLLGQYVNMGIHLAGSLGTTTKLNSTYFTKIFGLLADYDRNGFATSSPGFSGDYMVYGELPVEGECLSKHKNLVYLPNPNPTPSYRMARALHNWH